MPREITKYVQLSLVSHSQNNWGFSWLLMGISDGNTTWSSPTKTEKVEGGGKWLAHPTKLWGKCRSGIRDGGVKCSSALFLCLTPMHLSVHQHHSLRLSFQENTTLTLLYSHLDHQKGTRKKRTLPQWFYEVKPIFSHPSQFQATALRSLNGE